MEELWKNHDCGYEVSSFGRVRDANGKLVPQCMEVDGSKYISVGGLIYVHRLVAEAFIGKPSSGQVVKHIDGDKTNNFAGNLVWTDELSETSADVYPNTVRAYSKDGRELLCVFGSTAIVKRLIGVGAGAVSRCCRRQYGEKANVRNVIWRFASDDEFYRDGMEPSLTFLDMIKLCGTFEEINRKGYFNIYVYNADTSDCLDRNINISDAVKKYDCSFEDIQECCAKLGILRGFKFRFYLFNEAQYSSSNWATARRAIHNKSDGYYL